MRSALRHSSSTLPRLLARTSIATRTTSCLRATTRSPIPRSFPNAIRHLHQSSRRCEEQAAVQDDTNEAPALFTKFQELADHGVIHPRIVQTLVKNMGLDTMTEVQSRTISTTVQGVDCIAQARTGTGKTIAFLLPILQNIIKIDANLARPNYRGRRARTTADDIRAIIISPTRELAEQIAQEARRLVEGTSIVVQAAVGGTQKSAGLRAIQRDGCHILVATPGRLNDILSDSYSRVQAPDLSVLVFDEADRLMDAGFWSEIQSLSKFLPDPKQTPRQTLMFSATVSKSVVEMVRTVMRPGFAFEQCVNKNEEPTHERVPQYLVATNGLENQLPALVELVSKGIEQGRQPGGRPFKAIVYFSATNEVALANMAINNLEMSSDDGEKGRLFGTSHPWGIPIFEIHSRLNQGARTRAADAFRRTSTGVLLSSDVTARGLDFPDVTHVIQIGPPTSTEQYIHRIGRTARAGKEGEAWLFADNDLQLVNVRRSLNNLPIKLDQTLEIPKLDLKKHLKVSENAGKILAMTQKAMARVPQDVKQQTFLSLLGAYRPGASSDRALITKLYDLSKYGWGLPTPPSIPHALAVKLGVSRVPGVVVGSHGSFGDRGGDRGGRSFGDRDGDWGGRSFGDRGGRSFGDRGGDRGGRSFGDRGGRSFSDRGGRSFEDRGDRSFGDRGDRSFEDRGDGSFGDRGGDRGDRFLGDGDAGSSEDPGDGSLTGGVFSTGLEGYRKDRWKGRGIGGPRYPSLNGSGQDSGQGSARSIGADFNLSGYGGSRGGNRDF